MYQSSLTLIRELTNFEGKVAVVVVAYLSIYYPTASEANN